MKKTYYSNGKLLLTAEYLVLKGATALAIPNVYGQNLVVETIEQTKIIWQSLDENKEIWFECEFDLKLHEIASPDNYRDRKDKAISNRLFSILQAAKKLNSEFLNSSQGYQITTYLDFPRNWGLGTSSTLINNIAQWAKIDAYQLLKATFGGSGYDIAAAQYDSPILYTLNKETPLVKEVNLHWNFTDQLFFVYLNQKQNSQDAIAAFNPNKKALSEAILLINKITQDICNCTSLQEFEKSITQHESILASILHQKPVKQVLFKDYKGAVKSLGAWGGDFILATGNEKNKDYFRDKGFGVIIPFDKMLKKA